MTVRLYYDDSALTTFDAVVEACTPLGDSYDVRLDRTAFYPTSGGQPNDIGHLGGRTVVDVVDHGDGIAHLVDGPLEPGTSVRGEIDGARRRDHREQHSGQHVLSAALLRTAGIDTVGFHLGRDVSTIDLDREATPAEIEAAEAEANRLVRENLPVVVRYADATDADALGLRRAPKKAGLLRIVDIEGVDRSAWGGTHVARTGEIGLVAVIGAEKVRGGTRLQFVCGGRAEQAFREVRARLADAARTLGVGPADVPVHVARLAEANRRLERAVTAMQEELAGLRAPLWRADAAGIGPWRLVAREVDDDRAAALKGMAQMVVREPGYVVVVVGRGRPAPVVVARSTDVGLDAGAFVRRMVDAHGGRGGGRPELAQGGVEGEAAAVLAWAAGQIERLAREAAPG